ncbi:MAG: DNA mismatch repair endonuclease MutL [Synergistaceae bacterium]|nr:DNA mismatch repair endonuclease MutL [Synergistaceae bacterium]
MIKLLPEDVWAKIKAGEVVERPGSVVKELVENSIDVGAKRIRVSLWDGGKTRIIVEDDGGGIPFGDLPLAVERHATSKLSAVEDLSSIYTLGYRGEAIASIASVSKLEIRSRPENETGGSIRVSEGRVVEHMKTSCSKGTRVQVDDLFFNMPARKKFLKASLSELRRCSVILRDYALAWAGISFGLSHEGRALFTTDGNGDKKRAISQIWGDSPEPLMARAASGNLSLECWYQPFPSRGRNEVSMFVNGRAVNDPLIRAAVSAAVKAGKELCGNWALFITIDPSLIDVNIHPAKAEIRFRYTGEVFDSIKKASEMLSGNPAKLVFLNAGKDEETNMPEIRSKFAAANNFSFSPRSQNLFSRAAFDAPDRTIEQNGKKSWNFNEDDKSEATDEVTRSEPDVKFVSQLSSGYLIFETPSSVVIMDPHAAHERVMYEKIIEESAQGIKSQTLITPEPLQPTLALQAQEHEEALRSVGFSFKEENGLFVTATPFILGNTLSPLPILRATLAAWSESESGGAEGGKNLDEQLTARWAEIACKASVKLTSALHPEEALALWKNLHSCKQPYACPHGRPTMLEMENAEMAKHFGRNG